MRHPERHPSEHPVQAPRQLHPEHPERPAGIQAMNPRLWATIQAAIRQLGQHT